MSSEYAARLKRLPLGNICDANGKSGNMDSGIRPVAPGFQVAGPAYTVRCHPRDNLTIHKAIYEAPPGSVLVVDTQGYENCGYFGDVMALACQVRGIAGLVIDGGTRDSEDVSEMGFPIFCRAINPGGTVKETVGPTGGQVICGGVPVRTGDWIAADRDGVVVIRREELVEVLERAEAIAAREVDIRRRLEAGESSVDIYQFPKLRG